MVLNGQKG